MNAKRDLLPWSTLLYAIVVLASVPMTSRGGGAAPAPGFDPALAGMIAQIGTLLIPTLIFLALVREPAREMLSLRSLDLGSAIRSFVAGLLCWPMFTFLSILAMILAGLLHPESPASSTNVVSQGGSPWLIFLGVVLVAPLCEEILFRGVLLTTYQRRLGWHAIWMVAILFAFLHPSFDQALGAVFIGLVAGWVVYRTRSLWAGVLLHAGLNLVGGGLILLTSLAAPGAIEAAAQSGDAGATLWIGALVWGIIGLVMLAPVYFLLRSIARRHAAPEAAGAGLSLKSLWAPGAALVGIVSYAVYDLLQGV